MQIGNKVRIVNGFTPFIGLTGSIIQINDNVIRVKFDTVSRLKVELMNREIKNIKYSNILWVWLKNLKIYSDKKLEIE